MPHKKTDPKFRTYQDKSLERHLTPLQMGLLAVALVVLAAVVPVAIYRSFASGDFFGTESETGTLSSTTLITKTTDSTASGGSYIKFNLPPCPSGQQGTFPNCTTPPATCPPGQVGTPPNCTVSPPPATTWRPWGDGTNGTALSPWNIPINWSSAVKGSQVIGGAMLNGDKVYISTNGARHYFGSSTDPAVTVTVSVERGTFGHAGTFVDHIPNGAAGVTNSDHNMEVIGTDGYNYSYYDMNINWTNHTATAAARYKVPNTATGMGTFGTKEYAGPRAAGNSVVGGILTQADVDAVKAGKEIPHAMVFLLNNQGFAPSYQWPAISVDGNGGQVGPIKYGTLFGIDPSESPPAGSSAIVAAVFRAVQKYGAYDMDRTGGFTWVSDQGNRPVAYSDITSLDGQGPGSPAYILVSRMRPISKGKPNIPNHP
jgi:hypothetical protein